RGGGCALFSGGGYFMDLIWEAPRLFPGEPPPSRDPREASLPPPPSFPLANVRVMVSNVDEYWKLANEIGAQIVIPLADRYYGLRDFTIADPDGFGIRFASLIPGEIRDSQD